MTLERHSFYCENSKSLGLFVLALMVNTGIRASHAARAAIHRMEPTVTWPKQADALTG